MLELTIDSNNKELYDPIKNEFIQLTTPKETLLLEHSLLSVSKWEAKYKKAFLKDGEKTTEETLYYIRCMCTNIDEIDSNIFYHITNNHIMLINDYMQDKMSATHLHKHPDAPKSKDVITSDLIYYWLISLQIPFECERWHLNKLLTLIQVCNIKNQTPNKKGPSKNFKKNHANINSARRRARR